MPLFKISRFAALLIVCLTLTGCASTMLPYSDTFECPQADQGRCVNVSTAHSEALKDDPQSHTSAATPTTPGKKQIENALEVYHLALETDNDGAITMRGKALLHIQKELNAPDADRMLATLAEAKNVSVQKRLFRKAEENLKAVLASWPDEQVDPLTGLVEPVLAEAKPDSSGSAAEPPAYGGQPATRNAPRIMELYIAPYQTGFNAMAGGRTMWLVLEDASWSWSEKFNRSREVGSIKHPEQQ